MSQQRLAARLARVLIVAVLAALLLPSSALAIARDEVLARGKRWVDRNVPYDQTKYADESGKIVPAGLGYRTDCSGFVSMCWSLRWSDDRPRSLDTATLDNVSERIGKADLLPGDLLLRPKIINPNGHAVLFVAWLDPLTKTEYVAYEEKGTAYGTVCTIRDYPENGQDGYYPWRFLGIEEDYLEQIEPVRGYDRYETAVKASRSTFATGTVEAVVVASGADWPDALGGAALAGAYDAPVLLVPPRSVPAAVRNEIRRLGAKKAYLLGGPAALSEDVAESLALTSAGFAVTRIGGADRFETAALAASEAVKVAAERGKKLDGTVFVASGTAFPDALAASPASASGVRPILLAYPGILPKTTSRALGTLKPATTVLLGGEAALDGEVAGAIGALVPKVTRLGGENRYATAAAVADWSVANGGAWKGAGIATGENFPDALAGGVAIGERGSVLLLTNQRLLSSPSAASLRAHASEVVRVTCFGGMGAVSAETRLTIAEILGYVE